MPKIEVYQDALFHYAGRNYTDAELEAVLPAAKAELDEPVNDEGIVKIELNDTNRPDLWSAAGLGRLLRVYEGGALPEYRFFSTPGNNQPSADREVQVDAAVAGVRPYIVAFAAMGQVVDASRLNDLIQTQEKLCRGFGQKRKTIAMGIYRSSLIQYPVKYFAADPDGTRFVPLGMDSPLSLREILAQHPKGQEYGHIIAEAKNFPFLTDSRGEVLSLPPVINSARIGAVEEGDSELFVELTGTDHRSLHLAANIVACDMADMGFEILPVRISYPEGYGADLEFGSSVSTPFYFQIPQTAELTAVNKLLGTQLGTDEVLAALRRMGNRAEGAGKITLHPAEYRNDFLHPVDIMEDVMIGRGMNSFEPQMPRDSTMGRLTESEELARRVKSLLVGLGFQEMIFNYLSSAKDYVYRMHPNMTALLADLPEGKSLGDLIQDDRVVRIMNPMSENFEYVRPSILPSLLSAESVSGNAVYPHHVFEVGKVVQVDASENYGSRTWTSLGFLSADAGANFNQVYSVFGAISYYLGWDYEATEGSDHRFIPGRCVSIRVGERVVGTFGEIHPGVLENWGIEVPCTGGEFDLDALIELGYRA